MEIILLDIIYARTMYTVALSLFLFLTSLKDTNCRNVKNNHTLKGFYFTFLYHINTKMEARFYVWHYLSILRLLETVTNNDKIHLKIRVEIMFIIPWTIGVAFQAGSLYFHPLQTHWIHPSRPTVSNDWWIPDLYFVLMLHNAEFSTPTAEI